MGLLVTGVTRIVERISVITCIRFGWYKLFPQLVISFSFITSLDFARSWDHPSRELGPVSEYSHDVTAAILLFQTNLVGDGLFCCVKSFFCSHKFAWMLATWVNTLYTKHVKFERDLLTTNEEYILLGAPAKIGPDTNSHKLVLLAARFVRNADWLLEQCHRIWLAVGINGSWKRLFLCEWSAVSGEKDFAVFFIVLRSCGRKICVKMCHGNSENSVGCSYVLRICFMGLAFFSEFPFISVLCCCTLVECFFWMWIIISIT